ncbi:9790_t:CDS:2, partial [Racocetra fulgida]
NLSSKKTLSDENNEYNNNHTTNSTLSGDSNEYDNVTGGMPSKNNSGTSKLSKPNLKDLQLIPINKVPGKNQKFISMLIKDQLPINIWEGTGFIEFLAEFDPNYRLPCERHC